MKANQLLHERVVPCQDERLEKGSFLKNHVLLNILCFLSFMHEMHEDMHYMHKILHVGKSIENYMLCMNH